ncbi:NVEALA domain-containing protein [Viscerimonas tarda]
MKKKIFGSLAILAIAAVTVLNVNLSSQKELLSDISLANVEALAQDESDSPKVDQDCESCLTDQGHNGVRFSCKLGTLGCYDSNCVMGGCL